MIPVNNTAKPPCLPVGPVVEHRLWAILARHFS